MRQLTEAERQAMNLKQPAYVLALPQAVSDAYEAGFIAGLEHQDKRIEALEAKLLAWEQYNDGLINRRELAFRLIAEVLK